MCYKIIFYKIFQNALRIVQDIVILLLILKKKKKCHVFMVLNPKIVFEKIQTACFLIMKYSAFMLYEYIYIL
jgi:hypothetical protein